ncbi:MAG: alpha/beta hydrolase [Synergistaceae bacterium]|jgi:pimeloyl-ACP methyl ester carboxylesterase|nr:alpha/beta hydrolase [Synergistaceae bacterium]
MNLDETRNEKTHFGKKMRIDGIDVNYYDGGSGDAVVFLHGWGSDFAVFRPFLDCVAEDRRVCAPNLPGFGGTQEPPAAWGVDEYADFVTAFLKELGIDDAVLIGHSFGGRVIIKLAARDALAFRISKIILVNGAGIRHKRTMRQKIRLLVYKCVRNVLSLSLLGKKFPGLIEAWRRRNGSADYRNASPRMRECFVKVVNEDLTPLLSSIPCPALLIWGENDRETPVGDARIMERLIPDAGLVELKEAGHYSFLDQPFVFGKVLDSFLGIRRTS